MTQNNGRNDRSVLAKQMPQLASGFVQAILQVWIWSIGVHTKNFSGSVSGQACLLIVSSLGLEAGHEGRHDKARVLYVPLRVVL